MSRIVDRDYEFYDFNDDSDQEQCDSSEDDLDIILHGTPEQKRKLQSKVRPTRSDSSSEDDFEKEMNAELNRHIKGLEHERSKTQTENTTVADTSKSAHGTETQKFYDDVYFDSDEEEMVLQGNERIRSRQAVLSNDDLLYDPNQDEEDQQWVNAQRQLYQPSVPSGSKSKPLPSSDAVLNCPACMTLLCLDCQRHAIYQNQYRAMFVKNCHVDTTEILKQPLQKKKKRLKKQKKSENKQEEDDGDNFNPVKCTECTTVVGVYDTDEVYHFFNVLASHT